MYSKPPTDAPAKDESLTLTNMRSRLVRGLALSNLPRLQWLVDDLIPTPSLGFLYGPPKAGKSFAAIDLACSVATGRPWCGKPTRKGSVLYVVGEGANGANMRQEAWSEYHAEPDLDGVIWHPGAVNLMSLDHRAALVDLVAELEVDLVIVDTLARCSAGADENSTKEMGLFVEACDHLRDASSAAVAVVHHSGKDKSRGMRGNTALVGAADWIIGVSGGDGRVRLEVEEAKDFADGFTTSFAMEAVAGSIVLVEGAGGDTRAMAAKANELLVVLTEIATDAGVSATAWLAASEMAETSFYRARKNLVDRGLVTNVGTTRQPRYVVGVQTP